MNLMENTTSGNTLESQNCSHEVLQFPVLPYLCYRQCFRKLDAHLKLNMNAQESMEYLNQLRQLKLNFLDPFQCFNEEVKAAVDLKQIKVGKRTIELSPAIQIEITKWKEEFGLDLKVCVHYWIIASDAETREWVEKLDRLENGSISNSVALAARYFFLSEMEYKLAFIKELLRGGIYFQQSTKKHEGLNLYVSELVRDGLGSSLIRSFQNVLPSLIKKSTIAESMSIWQPLVADSIVFYSISYHISVKEIKEIVIAARSMCSSLKTGLPKLSPHLVNLNSVEQLLQAAPVGCVSLVTSVEQIGNLLNTIIKLYVAFLHAVISKKDMKRDVQSGKAERSDFCSHNDTTQRLECIVELQDMISVQNWEHEGFQSLFLLGWAALSAIAARNDNVLYNKSEQIQSVTKDALKHKVFSFITDILKHYCTNNKSDPDFYQAFQNGFELVFERYCSMLMVDVLDEMYGDNDVESSNWKGDRLDHIITCAVTLCGRNTQFASQFWSEDDTGSENGTESCHGLVIVSRDAASSNPAFLTTYLQLVAAAASGCNCAKSAFHHIKGNPKALNWDQFFMVMKKYYRLLTLSDTPSLTSAFNLNYSSASVDTAKSFSRSIRPSELEALETIQLVLQCVIRDPQLALIFYLNHEWSPVPTLASLLQCRIPSSLKGAIMKSLSIFARVPEIAPVVWRQIDTLQVLRTKAEARDFGTHDINYELEHFESMNRAYPATRGFIALLYELFGNSTLWAAGSEPDPETLSTIEQYFRYLLEAVFSKFHIRKYDNDEERWVLASGSLLIFRKILREGTRKNMEKDQLLSVLGTRLLQEILSSSTILDRIFFVLLGDGGIDNLEYASNDSQMYHAFKYCRNFVAKQAEKQLGPLNQFDLDVYNDMSKIDQFTAIVSGSFGSVRECCVQYALEILILVLENDESFIQNHQLQYKSAGSRMEPLHMSFKRRCSEFIGILRYVQYSKSTYIAELSAVVLKYVSTKVAGPDMMNMLMDSGCCDDIVLGYMDCLQNVYEHSDTFDDVNINEESGALQVSKKQYDGDTIFLPYEIAQARKTSHTLPCTALDLLLENVQRAAPNIAHLFLGFTKQGQKSANQLDTPGLDHLLVLLSDQSVTTYYPQFTERCHRLLYHLINQTYSNQKTLDMIEDLRCDYFTKQIESNPKISEQACGSSPAARISILNSRAWFLKTLAVYIHAKSMDGKLKGREAQRLVHLLVTQQTGADMILFQLRDHLMLSFQVPELPQDNNVIEVAQQTSVAEDSGFYQWTRIDMKSFSKRLQMLAPRSDTIDMSSKRHRSSHFPGFNASRNLGESFKFVQHHLQWASEWNVYSELIAAETHALECWRELLEVLLVDYFVPDENSESINRGYQAMSGGLSSPHAQRDLIHCVLQILLQNLSTQTVQNAHIFPSTANAILACSAQLQVFSALDDITEEKEQELQTLLKMVFRAICSSEVLNKDTRIAQNARITLYATISNITSLLPSSDSSQNISGNYISLLGMSRSSTLINWENATTQVILFACRDAREAESSLGVILSLTALEAILQYNEAHVKCLCEHGVLLQLIDLFGIRSNAENTSLVSEKEWSSRQIETSSVKTIHGAFISLFTRVCGSRSGAIALVEGGLMPVLETLQSLPRHRPRVPRMLVASHQQTFNIAQQKFGLSWVPVLRLICAICTTLSENRILAAQLLRFILTRWKLFGSGIKLQSSDIVSVYTLWELAYLTFIFRYVVQFPDLCYSTSTSAIKWDKISSRLASILVLFGKSAHPSSLIPGSEDEYGDVSLTDFSEKQGRVEHWLRAIGPITKADESSSTTFRSDPSVIENELAGLDEKLKTRIHAFTQLSVFDEEKLYASLMISCNAAAFCSKYTILMSNQKNKVEENLRPISNLASTNESMLSVTAPSTSISSSLYPLWPDSPSLVDFSTCISEVLERWEEMKQVLDALDGRKSSFGSNRSIGEMKQLQNVAAYVCDANLLVLEQFLLIYTFHIPRYMADGGTKRLKCQIRQLLQSLRHLETRPLIHSMCRKLRDLLVMDTQVDVDMK
uniref:Uncharacterized protein AlNc14C33G3013 n=1 Tax=Albugo laibachii Nc14 TaxID=890382 RepID=F0W836_9STRA|nr:conserved hypothetical protein [Albugo laibachii Nc14]|eukprot:CCA17319.1 conserved hypothetical protein [Albugo laibachii Nc14]